MKINHIWTVLCQRSAIDQDSNNVSLFEVAEEITVNVPNEEALRQIETQMTDKGLSFPFSFEIVSLWENLDGDDGAQVVVNIISPSGVEQELAKAPLLFNGNERLRQRVKVGGVLLKEFGRHEVLIKQPIGGKHKTVAKIPITFKLAVSNT